MFQGETAITVDDKGRMNVPSGYREPISALCGNRLVVTYNPFEHGCLWIFPVQEWEAVRNQVNALPQSVEVHRQLQRKLVGAATPVEVDGNGRVSLPASHRAAIGIKKNAVLLGMGSKFELWSEEAHLGQIRQTIIESQVSSAMLQLKL